MTLDHPDEEATDPEEGIKTILNFSYYDTTPLPNGSYSTKKTYSFSYRQAIDGCERPLYGDQYTFAEQPYHRSFRFG